MSLYRFCLCLCGLALIFGVHAQGQIDVLSDSTDLLIGDPVRCTVVVNVPRGAVVSAPIIGEVIAKENEVLELLEQGDPVRLNGQVNDTYSYLLTVTAWEPGMHELPPLTFAFTHKDSLYQLTSRPLMFTAAAPTVTGDSTYVADIKPLLAEAPNFWDRLYRLLSHPVVAILLLLLLTLGAFYALMRYRNRLEEQRLAQSPEDWALERLAALRQSDYLHLGDVVAFHTEVSFILRAYLKRRFVVDALERPNSEFLPNLFPHPYLPQKALYEELVTVLEQADLIKFAKASPLPIANEKALALIADLVATVQAQLEVLEKEASGHPSKTPLS